MSGGGPWTPQHKKKVDASGRRLPNASAECGDDRSSSSTSIGSTLSLFLCVRFCCCCFSYVTNWKSDSVKCFCFVFFLCVCKSDDLSGQFVYKRKKHFSWFLGFTFVTIGPIVPTFAPTKKSIDGHGSDHTIRPIKKRDHRFCSSIKIERASHRSEKKTVKLAKTEGRLRSLSIDLGLRQHHR